MKTKHTPAPWEIVKKPSMLIDDIEITIHTIETEANAKLIAAAPDLLEALKASQQIIMDLISSKRIVNLDESIAYNNSLIKRATE